MKKILATALSLTLAFSALTACGDSSSSSGSTAPAASSAEQSSAVQPKTAVAEPDLLAHLIDGKPDYIGMTREEFDDATQYAYSDKNAIDHQEEEGTGTYDKYSLGSSDTMLHGRLKLDKAYEQYLTLSFTDGKLSKATVRIEKITKEEAIKICDDFLKAIDGKLPEGYTQFKPVEHGRMCEVGFTKDRDDYVVSMRRDEDFDGDYFVFFDLEIYSQRYKM